MSVSRAQAEIDSREFTEWKALDLMDPGEPARSDWQTAMVAFCVSSIMRDPKSPPLRFEDFLLKFKVDWAQTGRSPKDKMRALKQKFGMWRQVWDREGKRGKDDRRSGNRSSRDAGRKARR